MIIDFHTHVFPDKLAPRALESLQEGLKTNSGTRLPTFSDATESGLRASMEEHEIDISVVLPIATTPKQTSSINEFAKKVSHGGLVSLGSVYPGQDGWQKTVEDLARDGFAGIKLHPEFQKCYVDSPEVIDLINLCKKLDMIVVFHAGVDSGVAPPVHCSPKTLRHALEYTEGDNVIAAHLGGYLMWDDVETYLVGTPVIFDTAMISRYIEPEKCADIIRKHGLDKIVCGSDSPWEGQRDNRNFLKDGGFTDGELDEFDRTAKRLLKL